MKFKLFSKRTKKKRRKGKKKGGIGNEQKIREYIFLRKQKEIDKEGGEYRSIYTHI